ncbi:putative Zn-dependent peptidase [Acinetobacter baumannii]|nr:putative Zn-dependent peptidase [Acinetobacter baumannii]
MKLHKFILVLNLVFGVYSITNDDANAQQEFTLYTTNFTEPLSYQGSAFLKLPKFP